MISFELIFARGVISLSLSLSFPRYGCLIVPGPLVEKTVFSILTYLSSFVTDKLAIFVWVHL